MSAVALEPVRPHMPVEGRTRDGWAYFYEPELRALYRAMHNHPANSFEWDAFTFKQYKYQLEIDAIETEQSK